ncbi:MAG: tripartite tricarboxylate transporter TctB family protein, partial [Thermodesulfobacteriota bacterium]
MRRLDLQSSFFWMIVSAVTVLLSSRFPFGTFANPGPGFLPLSVGVLMFLLSLILFVQSLLKGEEREKILWAKGATTVRVLLILASLIVYGLLLESLGFILMTFLLMSFLLLAIGSQRIILAVLISLFSSIGCYAVFQLWLEVQLPKGIFG